MLSARSCLLLAIPAVAAFAAPAQAAPALRSAFVPVATAPATPLTVVKGSVANKPGANGECGGPLVGTGKQRKQMEKEMEAARVEARKAKAERDAAKQAARDSEE